MLNKYYIYIIECENNKLYTGITTDYKRRFREHLGIEKNGAKFTKSFRPIKILLLYETIGRANAIKLECRIKKLKKIDKLKIINNHRSFKYIFKNILDINLYKKIKI